ncbi:MAG: T9SS type A sorting domain-containing protein [Bacteroidia bacterium]|nr:T9SS type A sorting domain-containing protein [Bacteroidia bacterium]
MSIIKDTSNIVISKLEIKDSTFKDGCGKQANYSRYYSFKKNTGDVLQIITVYEGLGAFFQYIQNQSNKIKLIETPQFYISNGQFCGDSSVMKSLRNVSIDIIQDDFIQAWPNPFNTSINTSIIGLYQFKFVDIYGRTMLEGVTDDTIINTVNLPSGLYHLILEKENQLFSIKVIKS